MQETIFGMGPGPSGLPQLFSSNHVEEGVPLQAVVRKVAVHCGSGSGGGGGRGGGTVGAAAHGAGTVPWDVGPEDPAYQCCFHYDHMGQMLGLPRSGQGAL